MEKSVMKAYSYLTSLYDHFQAKKKKRYIDGLIRKGLRLGKNVYIPDTFFFDPSHCFLISIGDNCKIGQHVKLIAHDGSTKFLLGYTKIGKIDIKDNSFVGDSTIIFPGVTVGPNSIVGAGAVVTKDVPPNMIAVGNPARVISTVQEYIQKIKSISKDKKIFGKDYYIENLDDDKRREIIQSIGNSIGFIV